jgi:RNA polymerase primary sigma factor
MQGTAFSQSSAPPNGSSIFSLFGSAGIEVIDSEQDLDDEISGHDGGNENSRKSGDLDFSPFPMDKVVDPARLYFREMANVPLLNRESEVVIAKRIEHGHEIVLNALSRPPGPSGNPQPRGPAQEQADYYSRCRLI